MDILKNITKNNDYGVCGEPVGVVAQAFGANLAKGIIENNPGATPALFYGAAAVWLATDGLKKRQPKKAPKCLAQKVASGVVIGTLSSGDGVTKGPVPSPPSDKTINNVGDFFNQIITPGKKNFFK